MQTLPSPTLSLSITTFTHRLQKRLGFCQELNCLHLWWLSERFGSCKKKNSRLTPGWSTVDDANGQKPQGLVDRKVSEQLLAPPSSSSPRQIRISQVFLQEALQPSEQPAQKHQFWWGSTWPANPKPQNIISSILALKPMLYWTTNPHRIPIQLLKALFLHPPALCYARFTDSCNCQMMRDWY